MTVLRSFSGSLGNRLTVAASSLWLVYVVAARPFADEAEVSFANSTHWYEKPALLFVAFGQRVAKTVGLYPQDDGAVQVLSGLLALIICVQAACWVKGKKV